MIKRLLFSFLFIFIIFSYNSPSFGEDVIDSHKIAAKAELKESIKAEESAKTEDNSVISPTNTPKVEETIDKAIEENKEKASSTIDSIKKSEFAKDMEKIRDILVDSAGDRPLLRGMMLPMFQPIFIMVMFCFGIWASQISDRVPIIWSVPAALFLSIVLAAFITAFHTEWKPDLTFKDNPYLPDLSNIQVTAMLCALSIGIMVTLNKSISPLGDILFAGAIGFISGFSQSSIQLNGKTDLLIFWIGFGLTAIILNIIGIGFETFLKSMKLSKMVQLFGLLSVILGCILAVQVF